MATSMMSPKPSKGTQASANAGSRTPTGKGRSLQACLERQNSRPGSHPVEVVGRIREHPEGNDKESAIRVLPHSRVAVRAEGMGNGCREFSLDGVSLAAMESLQAFYGRYVESRVEDVKAGGRCTIMMYGPTGAGKSYTMFGAAHEKGVAYHALSQLMAQRGSDTDGEDFGDGSIEVRASVWEIYNEEIYDLLASVSAPKSGFGTLFKMSGSSAGRVKLEVMGKKVKACMTISGTDPQKVLREISKVESRRVVKSTNCNDRSSRSHCLVTIDVPEVGGKLILVDMAGSENIDQAGLGRELKMQTGKINQGNAALKRVVEAIANGDSYIPYRDSKLTMLLQDSFEDDRAKILMVLCASPDVRDLHKTICTLEYGAKAKCIVRLPSSPSKEQVSAIRAEQVQMLEAQLTKKDVYIERLRKENEERQRQNEERERELERKERELLELREKDKRRAPEKEVRKKRKELHDGDEEDLNESPSRRRKIEELTSLVATQQREIDLLRIRAEKAEAELLHLQRSYNVSGQARVGLGSRAESSDGREGGGVESLTEKRTASSFGQSPIGSNQKFEDIQKEMTDRILAAQAESDRIIAESTPELTGVEKSDQRVLHGDLKAKSSSCMSSHDGSILDREYGSASPHDVMSLTLNSRSLMLLKNLVKERERQSSLGLESGACEVDVAVGEKSGEDVESEGWTGERLCSKGWLPIILEEDERVAQSMEGTTSATPQSSGAKDYFKLSTQVTPEMANPPKTEKTVDHAASLTFPSPEEQFNTAIANYSNSNGLGSPLFGWGDSGSKLNDPSPTGDLLPSAGLGMGGAAIHSDFVSGELKEWTPHELGQLERRMSTSALKTHSPLTALAEAPQSGRRDERGVEDEPISSMRSLDESPSAEVEIHESAVEPEESALLNVATDIFDGSQSGGSDAEAARRARIESIFLLCGERRELARKATGLTPVGKDPQESMADVPSSGRYSPTSSSYGSQQFTDNQLDQSISDFSTSPSFSDQAMYYTDVSVSSLPSLMPSMSPQIIPSSRRPTRRMSASIFANENSQPKQDDAEKIDVYVKWEKSSDSAEGKQICIVNVSKSSTLSELRDEIEAHVPVSKKKFKFLFLGETWGAPVDPDFESNVRVGSLPACHDSHGSRLACLRPPVTDTGFVSPRGESKPLRALDNQLPLAIDQTMVAKGKSTASASPGRGSSGAGHSKGLRAHNSESGRPKSALAQIVDSRRCM